MSSVVATGATPRFIELTSYVEHAAFVASVLTPHGSLVDSVAQRRRRRRRRHVHDQADAPVEISHDAKANVVSHEVAMAASSNPSDFQRNLALA